MRGLQQCANFSIWAEWLLNAPFVIIMNYGSSSHWCHCGANSKLRHYKNKWLLQAGSVNKWITSFFSQAPFLKCWIAALLGILCNSVNQELSLERRLSLVLPQSNVNLSLPTHIWLCMWRLKTCKTEWLMKLGNQAYPVKRDEEQQRQFCVQLPWDSSSPPCDDIFVAEISVTSVCVWCRYPPCSILGCRTPFFGHCLLFLYLGEECNISTSSASQKHSITNCFCMKLSFVSLSTPPNNSDMYPSSLARFWYNKDLKCFVFSLT